MPIYEYVCRDCSNDFERLQSFNDPPITTCPECNGHVRRVISPAGVIFKGSGWYITDHRRQISDKRSSAGGDAATKDAPAGGSEAGAPAAAPATASPEGGAVPSPSVTHTAAAESPAKAATTGASPATTKS